MARKNTSENTDEAPKTEAEPTVELPTDAPAEEPTTAPGGEKTEAEPVEAAVPSPTLPESDEITICDPKGNKHRVYSRSVHGDSFKELASEYIASRPGWFAR